MAITFKVTPIESSLVRGYDHRGNHYLQHESEYREAGCKTVVRETPWDALTTSHAGNGFVYSVVRAYNQHHKLVLRPDDVWLAIAIQFGSFVNANAEDLRHHFVAHTGKKKLVVRQSATLDTADYTNLLARDMVKRLRENITDQALCDWILPAFSTTTENDRVVGSSVLMASMKAYFDYKMELSCGIPEVTLLGTPDDWDLVHRRVAKLRSYGEHCAEWAGMLENVTGKIAQSALGDVPADFWQRICDYRPTGSGPTYLSGWISAFCVFDEHGQWQGAERKVTTWNGHTIDGLEYPVIKMSAVPPGYLTTDIEIYDKGVIHPAVLFAGHAVFEAPAPDTVAPKLTWALVLKDGDTLL
jgi:hypothetical protein